MLLVVNGSEYLYTLQGFERQLLRSQWPSAMSISSLPKYINALGCSLL